MHTCESFVNKSVQDTVNYLEKQIPESISSTEFIEKYFLYTQDGKCCGVMFFEKYYLRNANRTSLTLTIDDFNQATHVRATASAGGGLFFNFDWGAGKNILLSLIKLLNTMR